jgi:thioredoxin-related protein
VLDAPFSKNSHIGGPSADIHQSDTQLLFLFGENSCGRCKGLQNDIQDIQTGPIAAFDDVLS